MWRQPDRFAILTIFLEDANLIIINNVVIWCEEQCLIVTFNSNLRLFVSLTYTIYVKFHKVFFFHCDSWPIWNWVKLKNFALIAIWTIFTFDFGWNVLLIYLFQRIVAYQIFTLCQLFSRLFFFCQFGPFTTLKISCCNTHTHKN